MCVCMCICMQCMYVFMCLYVKCDLRLCVYAGTASLSRHVVAGVFDTASTLTGSLAKVRALWCS